VSEVTATVERIGARGDGIVVHQGRTLHVPLAAPGDVVRISVARNGDAELIGRLADGPRREPPCSHFGSCGGCALQHLRDDVYAEAKTELVREALARRGLDPGVVAPLERTPPATRRRARLALARSKSDVAVGFHARASRRIVDLRHCPVLHPDLMALVATLRAAAATILRPGDRASAGLTRTDAGIDLLLDMPRPPDRDLMDDLAAFAERQDLARLSWRADHETPTPIVQRRPVRMSFSGVAVDLPVDGFVQASEPAETALRGLASGFVGDARAVADLFCGIGPFSFAFAATAHVHAVDGDPFAIAALRAAANRTHLNNPVTTERRNLETRPLRTEELKRFEAVLFDPPYAGAKAQAVELARSDVARIVAVSCHPASLARDARILVDGGYRLRRVVPIDQFVWSAEIELVAWFAR
jgi:23S rRNA (uracil1939-C5)-methyltransferase